MKVTGLQSIERTLQDLRDNLDDEVNNAASSALESTERTAKRRIVSQDAIETTELYHSFIRTTVNVSPKVTRHMLNNYDPKAKYVEYGTGGHFGEGSTWGFPAPRPYQSPSMSVQLVYNILGWIINKPGFTAPRDRAAPPREAAPAIAKSIADGSKNDPSGTPPQPFMRPAWAIQKWDLHRRMRGAAKRAVRRA